MFSNHVRQTCSRGLGTAALISVAAGLAALSLSAVLALAHQHHDLGHDHDHSHGDGHDPTSATHATSRLWDPSNRGSLIALDLDHAKFTALYFDMRTESIQSWSTPVCLIDRGARPEDPGADQNRFQLCPLDTSSSSAVFADVFDGALGEPFTNPHNGIRTFSQPGVGQVYTDLLAGFESQSVFANKSSPPANAAPDPSLHSIRLASPITRTDLKHAGIADIRTFWRLTSTPLHARDLLTPTQILTVYLGLILRHVSGLLWSGSHMTVSSARIAGIIPVIPGTWPAYKSTGPLDSSPLSALLRALPAFDSHPPSVFRTLVRPVATVHGAQVDQIAECLHRSLRALVVHRGKGNSAQAHVVNVPLSDFVSVEPAQVKPAAAVDVAIVKQLASENVTHVMLTGGGWTHRDIVELREAVPHADVLATGTSDWRSVPYLSAAATILDQQYSTCSCGKRDTMVARCDLITRAGAGAANGMSQVVAAAASPAAPLVLAADAATDYYARHFLTGQWTFIGRQSNSSTISVHERGWDVGGHAGQCIPRADPRDLQQRKHISKHRVVLGMPPAWAQIVCLNPYHVSGRVKRLGENGVEAAVVEWWVVDKRWFSPNLGKDEGSDKGKGKAKSK